LKTLTHSYISLRVRIKPGRFIKLPPHILDGLKWTIGDILCVTVAGGGMTLARLPDEVAWQIDLLRLRTGSTAQVASASPAIQTHADYLRLRSCKGGRMQRTDNQNRTVRVS
jgi:hypothetical protein